jgi:ABC-2 type transport system ATP-binding protein
MQQAIVKTVGLSHRYSVQWAIRDINIEINGKGVFGLLGANGAGKSTTMNIMCGVLNQTHGDVYVKGVNLQQKPIEAKKYIGFLPQKPPLYGELTVQEYLEHTAKLRLMPYKLVKAALEEAMEKCNITHFRNRMISNLSGGYQQRVGIAQSIIHKPEFVVMDEPTNGLDPNQILEIRHLIKEIAEERTVVLSTHILQEVQALCDYIYMINDGVMVFAGTMHEFDQHVLPNSLIITLRHAPVTEELEQLEAVQMVEAIGLNKFRIQYADARDATEQLIGAATAGGWGISEIYHEKNSLDRIFAELSRKRTA